MIGIGDDKRGRGFEPRRYANRLRIGDQGLIRVLVPDISDIFRIVTIDRANEDAAGDTERLVTDRREKFFCGQNLAALHPVDVGYDTFDFVDIMFGDPARQIDRHCFSPV